MRVRILCHYPISAVAFIRLAYGPLLCLGLLGCHEQLGRVDGTVTAPNSRSKKSEPIQFGRITFYNPQAKVAVHATIKDGSYTANDVPIGNSKIAVYSFDLAFQEKGQIKGLDTNSSNKVRFERGKYFPINPRFGSLTDTPLEFDVKPGEQQHDVQITDELLNL